MGTVTTGSLKFPCLAAGRVKCTPMGSGWGRAPPHPHNLAFGLRVGCSTISMLPWSRWGSQSRWMVLMTLNTLDSMRT